MNSTNTIRERISVLRKAKGFTQEELASAIGVSAQSVSKWETGTTMPDILLLPVLADLFDVTVDALFGKEMPVKERTVPMDDAPEAAYEALLVSMQQAWCFEESHSGTQEENARNTRVRLEKCPQQQTQINSYRAGVVYANADLGLVYRRSKEESLPLLKEEDTADFLRALADPALRKILTHQVNHEGDARAFTASSMAVKCGIREEEAEAAFQSLVRFRLAQMQEVETGAELIRVYSLWGSHKLPLLYAFFSLASRLADYQESYFGLRS